MENNYDRKKIHLEGKISVVLALIAGAFLVLASVVMFLNIVTRTAINFNIKIVYELCQLCSAGIASFAIPYATIKFAHTEMDIITSHLKPRVRSFLGFIAGVVTVVVMIYVCYMLYDYAVIRTAAHEVTTTNHLPTWVFRWVFAAGMTLTTIMAAIDMVDDLRLALGKKVFKTPEALEGVAEAEQKNEYSADSLAETFVPTERAGSLKVAALAAEMIEEAEEAEKEIGGEN